MSKAVINELVHAGYAMATVTAMLATGWLLFELGASSALCLGCPTVVAIGMVRWSIRGIDRRMER